MALIAARDVLARYAPHRATLDDAFASRMAAGPQRCFLRCAGRAWSWQSFRDSYLRLAGALAARGIGRGERVAIMAGNGPAHLLLMFALARLNAICVPVNPEFGVREAGFVFANAGVSAIVCDAAARAVAREASAGVAPQPWLAVTGGDAGDAPAFEALCAGGHPAPLPADEADATFIILYTSGTTGFPKGVMHSQRSFVLAGERHVERVRLQPDDRLLCVLPLFHNNALFNMTAGCLAAGCRLVLEPRFSASRFWRTVADEGVTQVNVMAAVSTILARRPRGEFVPGHRLRVVNGSGFTPETLAVFRDEFAVPKIVEGLGMTEIPGAFSIPYDEPYRLACMGKAGLHPDHARAWTAARVVDDAGRDVADGAVGELLVKIPTVMQGYWREPAQTAAAFRDGWFVTGDLVRREPDGCFYHVGRKKDLIRRRGENIAAAEIEQALCAHPGVAEAAALAVPAEIGEEEILAVCVARPAAAPSAADLRAWCATRLAAFKLPRYIAFVDALPHTPTHKIAKHRLLEERTALLVRAVDLDAGAARGRAPA